GLVGPLSRVTELWGHYGPKGRTPPENGWRKRTGGAQNETRVEGSALARDPVPRPAELVPQLVGDELVGADVDLGRVGRGLRQRLGLRGVDPQHDAALIDLVNLVGVAEAVPAGQDGRVEDDAVEHVPVR